MDWSANDWQGRGNFRRGGPDDRNVELVIPSPFAAVNTGSAAVSEAFSVAAGG